ncbi:MAG: malate synthase G [Gammaproteobacteria bacterium]|nr:malate synthase G [Gammaproteobacteria bacterium]
MLLQDSKVLKNRVELNGFEIDRDFYNFIETEACVGLPIDAKEFFKSLTFIVSELTQENSDLLNKRDIFQAQINAWHTENSPKLNATKYKDFLSNIGYLLPQPEDFSIEVDNVDDEIALIAGPQLVVPVSNARFALNAVNARWGSLFDSLYGTDVIPNKGNMVTSFAHNLHRVKKTADLACDFLDEVVPLKGASYRQIIAIERHPSQLIFILNNGQNTTLVDAQKFIGFSSTGNILLLNNNLHMEVVLDQESSYHKSGIFDVLLESAISTIVDFEDSAATVSAEEKINAYRNYLGLMKRNLSFSFVKSGDRLERTMNEDLDYIDVKGRSKSLPGCSLILVRHVGLHMNTDLIKAPNGESIPEGILDAMVTTLAGLHDLQSRRNSKKNSLYVVKPKMHGPEEVAFTVKLFSLVEEAFNLQENTIKMGIMDEERRTSLTLKACVNEAKNRIIFINTGFLDRTGDEIHTSMLAGPMRRKNEIKEEVWLDAYERNNVSVGLQSGFFKRAQIGKGMWAQPDLMRSMMDSKMAHLEAGASCAWVPSPTAATLHATHYHRFSVHSCQKGLQESLRVNQDELLKPPLMKQSEKLTSEDITNEIHNNVQGILGYVVRWVDQGVGCSKVQDINHIDLMEDRATLRISSQHMANWLHHDICTKEQVIEAFEKMAVVVDEQNKLNPNYQNLAPDYDGFAYQASLALVFEGKDQPNGYTEDVLIRFRRKALGID